MPLTNAIAIINGKGGVLKTSTAAHVAGLAADTGWDVLVVDADGQANLSRDLGYIPDGGEAFAAALLGTAHLEPIQHPTRKTLHYVSGGEAVDNAVVTMSQKLSLGQTSALLAFEQALAPIAHHYDLIVVDSPPRDLLLRRMLLATCRYMVVPSGLDATGIDGIADVFKTVAEARATTNPQLEMLGVLLGPVQQGATRTLNDARTEIDTLFNHPGLVFDATIRSTQSIARDCRELGILTNEYEVLAEKQKRERRSYWQMTPEERVADKTVKKLSGSASNLAQDWQNVTNEIIGRFLARNETAS